jgi:hypothetical protein
MIQSKAARNFDAGPIAAIASCWPVNPPPPPARAVPPPPFRQPPPPQLPPPPPPHLTALTAGGLLVFPPPWLAPLPLLRTGACRPGLRPRGFSAHRPVPQLQVHAPAWGVTPHPLAKRFQTGKAPFFKPFSQSGQILCRFRLALQRKSGPRIALPAHRLYYPVDIWRRSPTRGFCGDLRGAP